jgi:hypothetical protein
MLTINELSYTLDSLHKNCWKPKSYRIQKTSIWERNNEYHLDPSKNEKKRNHFRWHISVYE